MMAPEVKWQITSKNILGILKLSDMILFGPRSSFRVVKKDLDRQGKDP